MLVASENESPVKIVKVTSARFVPGAGSYFVSDDELAKMTKNADGSYTETYD